MLDGNLKQFATDRQWEILSALDQAGTQRGAAELLGCARNLIPQAVQAVNHRAAKSGYSPDHSMTKTVPDGFRVRGVSSHYNADGNLTSQWVKSQVDLDQEEALFKAACEAMASELPKVDPTVGPETQNTELMNIIPIGDQHVGMLAWNEETLDGDYDLKISESRLIASIDHLVKAAPEADTAMILVLGDFLHYDSFEPVSKSGNLLDADSRFPRMVRVAMRMLRYAVTAALTRHREVILVIQEGNHDRSSSVWLREAFSQIYEDEQRLSVDTTPRPFSCHQFGKCMVASHHGDKVRAGGPGLPMLFATDYPEIWGATPVHRVCFTGHVHHDQVILKEHSGMVVESVRVLAPKDAWHSQMGYRSKQDMKAITIHKEYGEVSRISFNPEMIDV